MDDEIFIECKCPGCGDVIAFPEHRAGRLEECPLCLGALVIPNDDSGAGRVVPLTLDTPRLRLRHFTQADGEAALQLFNDDSLLDAGHYPAEEIEMRAWIDKQASSRLAEPGEGWHLAIELKDRGPVVGFVTVHCVDLDRHQAAIFAGVVGDQRRQGYGAEALRALLEFCLRDLGMHRVTASCDSTNTAARCTFERIGMRGEGEFKKDRLNDGAWVDTVHYALLQEELGPAPGSDA